MQTITRLILLVVCFNTNALAAQPSARNFFEFTNLWVIELSTSSINWEALCTMTPERTNQVVDVNVGGRTYPKALVRLKGGGTMSGVEQGRPPLRIVFQGDSPAETKELSLNNNYYDSSFMRDALSYKLFRDFGVPAPKTAYAKLYVTFTGQRQRKFVGLYTITEVVDEHFVRRELGAVGGLLMKPELADRSFRGVTSWSDLSQRIIPKTTASPAEQDRLMAFVKLVNEAPDAEFHERIGTFIDLENYLRFVVVNVMLANLDSYLGMGKNYYIFLNSKTRKLQWIPWDHDLSFGGFFLAGTPAERINLSINEPSSVNDLLLKRLLEWPQARTRYLALLGDFLRKHFSYPVMALQIDALAKQIEGAVAEEGQGKFGSFHRSIGGSGAFNGQSARYERGMPPLKDFVSGRVHSVQEQLEGKMKGDQPSFWLRAGPRRR